MNFLITFLLISITGLHTGADVKEEPCVCEIQQSFPVPPEDTRSLFYIQRTPNTNTIMYDLNLNRGIPDPEEPVHVYWLRYGEQGQKEELSFIQEHYAYGLKTKKIQDKYELRFVSYKKLPFYLARSPRDDRYRIVATINGREIEVSRVFLQIEGGSFWLPNVVCVEVKGNDPATGKEIVQTFKP